MTTIALVDDEQSILTSVSLALEAEGYNVDTYKNGVEALQGLESKEYDLGLFDIKMPKMDGGWKAVILSGYMRILSPLFVKAWKGRLLNIHPSLLPKYPGAHAHRDALADGATVTGCTVHFVDEGVDSGLIIAQQEVAVLPNDNEATLSERVKKVEHILYPATIDAFAAGEVKYE